MVTIKGRKLPELRYIDTVSDLTAWADEIKTAKWIGVDTESDSMHHYTEKVCLVQMTADNKDVIIDVLGTGTLAPLESVFSNPAQLKIFHDAGYDLIGLQRDYNVSLQGLFDTMVAARINSEKEFGLANVLRNRFGVELDKRWQKSDWSMRPLATEQLEYARLDTHFLPELAQQLQDELVAKGRWEWAKEEFAQIPQQSEELAVDLAEREPTFWRIKNIRKLSPEQKGRARSLHLLRDRMAKAKDRPPFRVFPDYFIVQVAQRYKTGASASEMGVSEKLWDRYGKAVEQAVAESKSVNTKPPPDQRRSKRSGRFRENAEKERYEALRTLRKEIASAHDLDPEVLVNNASLSELVRNPPKNLKALLGRSGWGGWRGDLLGKPLMELLESEGEPTETE